MKTLDFIIPMGPIRVCEIRLASTGVICVNPYLVCKKYQIYPQGNSLEESICFPCQTDTLRGQNMHLQERNVVEKKNVSESIIERTFILTTKSFLF